MTTRSSRMEAVLHTTFAPQTLTILDESAGHRGRAGTESHFKVTIVSDAFTNVARVARHRLVQAAVKSEWDLGLHALSIDAFTPTEWEARGRRTEPSPACRSRT